MFPGEGSDRSRPCDTRPVAKPNPPCPPLLRGEGKARGDQRVEATTRCLQTKPGVVLQEYRMAWESMSINESELKQCGLVQGASHLPYDPKLVVRAKELRKRMSEAEKKL